MDYRYCLTVIILLLEIVAGQRVVINGCTNLNEGITVILTATLDTTSSASLCTFTPLTKATFRFTNAVGVTTDICEQNVTSTCDTTVKTGGCACLSKVGEMWTFTQPFTYQQANHQGGTIDLVTNCIPEGTFGFRQKCQNIQSIAASSSTTTPCTTTPTTNSTGDRVYKVGEVLGIGLGTFGGCCVCGGVFGVILAVMFKLYRETKILFDPHGKQLTEEVIQKIMKHIVEHFKTKHIQGSTYISFVFGKDKKDPNTVTIFGKEKELFNAVVCEIQEIINKYNPGAHPRKLNAGGRDNSHELGNRNKDNS